VLVADSCSRRITAGPRGRDYASHDETVLFHLP
jgi:hypothetical protein